MDHLFLAPAFGCSSSEGASTNFDQRLPNEVDPETDVLKYDDTVPAGATTPRRPQQLGSFWKPLSGS